MSEAKARANDPETSWEAAESVNVPRDKRAVLWALNQLGTASDNDIAEELSTAWLSGEYPEQPGTEQSLRSRRKELMRHGYIEQAVGGDGKPAYGKTACNRRCRLFLLTRKGFKLAVELFG